MDRAGNYDVKWHSTGPQEVNYFPSALELSLTLASGEQYTRLFTLSVGR